jgi:pimeloyl-ACP methyl ester carboxylesterase
MLPLLPPNLQLITVDLPGHGGSFRMERYSLASIAEVIAELLVGLAARPAIVFGHSFGGHVGMVLADRRPDLMKGLIVGDTPLDLAHLKNHLCGSEKMLRHWMTIAGRNLPIDELAILVGQTPIQMAGSEATLGSMFDLQHPYIRACRLLAAARSGFPRAIDFKVRRSACWIQRR